MNLLCTLNTRMIDPEAKPVGVAIIKISFLMLLGVEEDIADKDAVLQRDRDGGVRRFEERRSMNIICICMTV